MPRIVAITFTCCLLALGSLTAADDVTVSQRSGDWSDPQVWQGGKVPAAGARVLVRGDHTIVYDVASDVVIRGIHIAGELRFAPDRDTELNVGLIKIEPTEEYDEEGFDCSHGSESNEHGSSGATLRVGSRDTPITVGHRAVICLHAVEGLDPKSCPAIVCCGGRMDFHGAPLPRTWSKLASDAAKGSTKVSAVESLAGWRVGDRVIVTATEGDHGGGLQTEMRFIKAINGQDIVLDEPLKFAHRGSGELRGEIANLSRNVVVESADPQGVRGHTMYHHDSTGSISYAEFRHLGKKDTLGRYSLHFHLLGNSMRGSSVIGASIWDSHNRWLTIHGTNYLVVRDCVGFRSVGHGFFLEDGTEVFNVLDRNLAVQAMTGKRLKGQVLPFDGNEGAGFWWANSLNTFTRNVSCENERYGYRFEATPSSAFRVDNLQVMQPDGTVRETDIRTLPFVRFEHNEAHCDGLYGINLGEGVNRVGPDTKHPFILRDTKVWGLHYAFRVQSPSVLAEQMHIEDTAYGVYHPHFQDHVYRDWKVLKVAAEPFNRGHDDDSRQFGRLTVDGIAFTAAYWGGDMPFIQISDDNPTGEAESHFRRVEVLNRPEKSLKLPLVNRGGGPRPEPKTEKAVPVYIHDYFGPGRSAKVLSTKARELRTDNLVYRELPPLTGDESRVAEVTDVPFPKLLDPVDDLPPQTIVLSATATDGGLLVCGVVADNSAVKQVLVNGRPAKFNAATGEFEIVLPAETKQIEAYATDNAGNEERLRFKRLVSDL